MLFLDVIILCLLPDVFPGNLGHSLAAKALRKQYMDLHNINVKEFDIGLHKSVDDKQFGGGGGMVIRPDGLGNTIGSVLSKCTYYFSA